MLFTTWLWVKSANQFIRNMTLKSVSKIKDAICVLLWIQEMNELRSKLKIMFETKWEQLLVADKWDAVIDAAHTDRDADDLQQ